MSVSPYYNKPTQSGIVEHFKFIANSTSLPIILYNVPGRTGSNMSAETTLELASISNIVAVKEASGNMSQIMEIIRKKPEDFTVLSGDDALTLPLISTGVEGVISVVANAFPNIFSSMVKDAMNGNFSKARINHYELLPITDMFFAEGNPGGVKVALEEIGIMKSFMRPPLYPVSSELESKIKAETNRLLN